MDPIGEQLLKETGPSTEAAPFAGVAQTPVMDPIGEQLLKEMGPSAGVASPARNPLGAAAGAGTPADPYQGIVEFSQVLQKARGVGELGFRESALGHSVAAGKLTLAEAEEQIAKDDRSKFLGEVSSYEKRVWENGNWIQGIPVSMAVGTVKQLPLLEAGLKVPGIAGGGTAGAVAITGIGLPFAIQTGLLAGSLATAGWTADLFKGQEYLAQRRAGIPHEQALAGADISANIQGALAGLRFGAAAKVPIDAAKGTLKYAGMQMSRFFSEGVQFSKVQIGLAQAQTASKLIVRALTATISKTPGAVPTVEEAAAELWDTLVEGLKTAPVLYTGGKVVGTGVGLAGRKFVKVVEAAVEAHEEKQAAKAEAIAAKSGTVAPISPEEATLVAEVAQLEADIVAVKGRRAAQETVVLTEGLHITPSLKYHLLQEGMRGGISSIYKVAQAKSWLLRLVKDIEEQAGALGITAQEIMQGKRGKWAALGEEKAEVLAVLGKQVFALRAKYDTEGLSPKDYTWLQRQAESLPATQEEINLLAALDKDIERLKEPRGNLTLQDLSIEASESLLKKAKEKLADLRNTPIVAKLAAPTPTAVPRKRGRTARAARRVARREAKSKAAESEINRIYDAADSLFTIETKESRKVEATRIHRVLKGLILNSDLPDAIKVRLLARVPQIQSTVNLLKHGADFVEEVRGSEYKQKVLKGEVSVTKAIASGQLSGKKSGMTPEAQAILTHYDKMFTYKRLKGQTSVEAREAALERAQDYVDNGLAKEVQQQKEQMQLLSQNKIGEMFAYAADLADKRRVAMEAMRYLSDSLTPEELNSLAGSIEQVVKTSKSEFADKKRAESARLLEQRAEVLAGVQGKTAVIPSKTAIPPKQQNYPSILLDNITKTTTALWESLFRDTHPKDREPLIGIADFTAIESHEAEITRESANKLTELYKDATGSFREYLKLMKSGQEWEKFTETYTDAMGETAQLPGMTLNEMTYLHMAFQDPGAVPGLVHGDHYTLKGMVDKGQVSTQEVVEHILLERDGGKRLDLAHALQDFYRWFAPKVRNKYLTEYGVELPVNDDYSGRIYHRGVEIGQAVVDLLEGVHSYMKQLMDPASTKLRKNSKLPIRLVDPFEQVNRHVNQMAFWMSHSEAARSMTFIFSNTSKDGLRDVIQHKLGKDFLGMVDSRLAFQFHLKPGQIDVADKVYRMVKNNMATGILGNNFKQAPQQWVALLGVLGQVDEKEFGTGLRNATNKKKLEGYLSQSGVYKDRMSQVMSQVLDATSSKEYLDLAGAGDTATLKELAMVPLSKWGDGVASAIAGYIAYDAAKSRGMSEVDAVLFGDRVIDRTQSSSRASQRVPAEFKGGASALGLTFTKQNIQSFNLWRQALEDAARHKDWASGKRAALTVVGMGAAAGLFQAVNTMPQWATGDEDDQHEALVRIAAATGLGPLGQIPMGVGDVVMGVASAAGGEDAREPRTILGGLVKDSALLAGRTGSVAGKLIAGEEISLEQAAKFFKSYATAASILTGLPFLGTFNTVEFGAKVKAKIEGE